MGRTSPILRNNLQRGFIQIPILIAILVGVALLGGTGYVAYEAGQKTSQNAPVEPVATSTTVFEAQSTTTTEASASAKQIEAKKQPSTTYTPPPVSSIAKDNQTSQAASSAADVAEVTGAINLSISKYQEIKSASAMLANRVRTDVAQTGSYLPQLVTLGDQVLSAISSFDTAIDSSILLLKVQKNQVISSGYVDRDFWMNTRMPQIVAEQNNYWKDLTAILNIYKTGSTEIVQAFVSKTLSAQSSQLQQYADQLRQQNETLYKPCLDWNTQVNANEQAFRKEVANAGGFTTDSQAMAIAIQRAGKPPAQCGGYSTPSVSSYSSTRCNYLNGMLDCTSSDGTRSQVKSSGSGFDISSW